MAREERIKCQKIFYIATTSFQSFNNDQKKIHKSISQEIVSQNNRYEGNRQQEQELNGNPHRDTRLKA